MSCPCVFKRPKGSGTAQSINTRLLQVLQEQPCHAINLLGNRSFFFPFGPSSLINKPISQQIDARRDKVVPRANVMVKRGISSTQGRPREDSLIDTPSASDVSVINCVFSGPTAFPYRSLYTVYALSGFRPAVTSLFFFIIREGN